MNFLPMLTLDLFNTTKTFIILLLNYLIFPKLQWILIKFVLEYVVFFINHIWFALLFNVWKWSNLIFVKINGSIVLIVSFFINHVIVIPF